MVQFIKDGSPFLVHKNLSSALKDFETLKTSNFQFCVYVSGMNYGSSMAAEIAIRRALDLRFSLMVCMN